MYTNRMDTDIAKAYVYYIFRVPEKVYGQYYKTAHYVLLFMKVKCSMPLLLAS